MPKYRKIPTVIEAFQLTQQTLAEKQQKFANSGFLFPTEVINGHTISYLEYGAIVEVQEGSVRANIDDWIITGVEGEIYPCPNSVFQKTYEAV